MVQCAMADDRKYKQRGYQDYGRKPQASPGAPGATGKARAAFTAYKEALRCDECGAELSIHFEIGLDSSCPACRAALHTCRNCLNLDPAARLECARPVAERVGDKRAANRCPLFEQRKVQVKETSFSTSKGPDDARRTLENLFKKK
jgi:hypothetical protein